MWPLHQKKVFLNNQLCYNFMSKLQTQWICYDCTAARTTGRVRQQPGFQGIKFKQSVILAFSCSNLGLFEVMISGEKCLDFWYWRKISVSEVQTQVVGQAWASSERKEPRSACHLGQAIPKAFRLICLWLSNSVWGQLSSVKDGRNMAMDLLFLWLD